MNKTTKTIATNKPSIVEVLKTLKPRQSIDNKLYKEYYEGLKSVLDTCYSVYMAREKGTATKEAESEAMAKVTEFLHTLGKANGKYISVCEKTTENGITSVLFDTLVYRSFKDRIYTKSNALASLEADKVTASKKKNEAHANLINGKGTATAYKEAVKAYDEAVKKVNAEREKENAEGVLTEKESPSKFIKFATARLKAIVDNRYSLTTEEAEALRKIRNKEAKEKRNGKKNEAKPKEAKKPQTSPEAVKKTA